MSAFAYKASTSSGKVVTGIIDAADPSAVRAKLEEMSYLPIEISSAKGKKPSLDLEIRNPFRRVSRQERLALTQQLASLVGAGIPLDRSVAILAELSENPVETEMLQDIHRSITGGSSMAEALEAHPRVFAPMYVNMVRVGETGGVLDLILKRLAEFMEQMEDLRSYVISSLMYPMVLVVVGGGSVAFLLTSVLPNFIDILEGEDATIPLTTQVLLQISELFRNYWWAGILAALVVTFALRSWRQTEQGRYGWDRFRMNVPGLGGVTRKLALARFARTLGTLTGSGVPILNALFIVKDVVGNEVISRAILRLHGGVREGEGIAQPLAETGVFPNMAIHMISVGEETGRLDKMLHQIADIYEADVRTTIKRLTALMEPLLLLVMAVVVGFIVLSIVTAMMSVTTSAG